LAGASNKSGVVDDGNISGVVEDFIFYRISHFIYESKSERIIEIGPHLPKLL